MSHEQNMESYENHHFQQRDSAMNELIRYINT